MKKIHLPCVVLGIILFTQIQKIKSQSVDYNCKKDIFYRSQEDYIQGSDSAMQKKCRLDIYTPSQFHSETTIIFFHGGGLTAGIKYLPPNFSKLNANIVSADYRLSPTSKCPSYLEDCAAAVAWTFYHIKEYGGSPAKIYLSGESAGAYLATMIFLDKHYLAKYNIDPDSLGGLFSFSGQMTTHFTICNENGLKVSSDTKITDKYAPLFHIRKTSKPLFFFIGDSALDMPGRYEQNKLMVNKLKRAGSLKSFLIQLKTFNHTSMISPAIDSLSLLIKKQIEAIKEYSTDQFSIYPNPVKGSVISVRCEEELIFLKIYSNSGLLKQTFEHIFEENININNLKPGTYIIEAKSRNRNFRQKLLVL